MATYSSPNDSQKRANSIETILTKLLVFRKKITSNYIKNNNNNDKNIIMEIIIKTVSEEGLNIQNQINSNQLYLSILINYLNQLIEDLLTQFHTEKLLEEEIVRLKEHFKTLSEEDKNFEEMENYLNTVQTQEKQREQARILIIMALLQELNEQYKVLEVEINKSKEAYTQDMLSTLEGLKKTDGTLFTQDEKNALNKDLAESEISLFKIFSNGFYLNNEQRNMNALIFPNNQNEHEHAERRSPPPILFRPAEEDIILNNILNNQNFIAAHTDMHTKKLTGQSVHTAEIPGLISNRLTGMKNNPNLKNISIKSGKMKDIEQARSVLFVKIAPDKKNNTLNKFKM